MRLPPLTPQALLEELRSKPDAARKLAFWGTLLGVGIAFAAAHFAFGEPVVDRDTGHNMTDGAILQFTAIFITGGLFFVTAAAIVRRFVRN